MSDTPERWSHELAPLGLRTLITCTDRRLLDAALRAYETWRETRPEDPSAAPIHLRLDLVPGALPPGEPDVAVDGRRLSLSSGVLRGEADAHRLEAWCTVPDQALHDPRRLASQVLDTLLLFLATRAGRVPVHAAGVLIGDTAVLLAGRSGSGKSTLALTASRAGLPILSDDTVYVQMTPRVRVWGFPRPIHVLPGADVEFLAAVRLRGGRWKHALPFPPGPAPVADRAALCLLRRGDRVRVERMDPAGAVEHMLGALEAGFDHFRGELPAAVRAIAAGGAWRLTLSAHPEEGLRALCETLADVSKRDGVC
jgi:hypothetical protein